MPGISALTAHGLIAEVGTTLEKFPTGRHFAKYISANFTLYIGYIMAGFDDQKRSLHDRICETRVIKK